MFDEGSDFEDLVMLGAAYLMLDQMEQQCCSDEKPEQQSRIHKIGWMAILLFIVLVIVSI